ncbi:hypothetical protein [Rhizobium phaseoli]|uniref:hypothetical protein n=1 Tax=Rhizobium phaseoli TaxID=396 RepID=UPI0002E34279|nr:hypothetical protein [Rhizobium phaseoli]KKZ89017.1 hypothetical protein RPHASCH2410_CH00040 [Rhizobium phaseoli Ch24-10]
MRNAAEYLRAKPHARASTLASREKIAATVEQLNRELAATKAAEPPARKSIIDRFMPWFRRRA